MITAQFKRQADGRLVSAQLTGHADSGPYGQDIICAATSSLALNTVNSLESLTPVTFDFAINEDEGGFIQVSLADTQEDKSQLLMEAFLLGMTNLADNASEYVSCQVITD